MSEALQWIVISAVVAAAVLHIFRRVFRSKGKGDCGCSECDNCPSKDK